MLEISKIASTRVEGVKLGTSFKSQNGKYIYHISIIDYLQLYDLNKKLERFYKIIAGGVDGKELSSMSSEPYKKRFLSFMKSKVFNYELNHQGEMQSSFRISKLNNVVVQDNHYQMNTNGNTNDRVSEIQEGLPKFLTKI